MKAREALNGVVAKSGKKPPRIVVTDAHTVSDLHAALSEGGMFDVTRTVVLDGVLQRDEMRPVLLDSLKHLRDSEDLFLILEEKPDAATKKQIEKFAETSSKFDVAKKAEGASVFAIGNAMRRGDKKAAWVALQRELVSGKAPEAIHGILFWAAKEMVLAARGAELARARKLVAELAELPHRSRRAGFELDCALEQFILSRV